MKPVLNIGCCWVILAGLAVPVFAQVDDPMARPTEYSLRMTPAIARGLARQFTKHGIIRRYELDESRHDEVTELVARRLMQAVHNVDAPEYQAVAEQMIGDILEALSDRDKPGGSRGMPPGMGMAMAKGVKHFMPEVRDLIRNVGQDIRPMLPFKQQLKLAADLMAVGTTLDAFEQTMERWSSGEVKPYENPSNPDGGIYKKDESGRTRALRDAQNKADQYLQEFTSKWERYVKQAKELYAFDGSQIATADSILSEMLQRADAITQDESWKQHALHNRLWYQLLPRMWIGHNSPLRHVLDRQMQPMKDKVQVMWDELKQRIERIPTTEQRRKAEERVMAALAEQGFGVQAETAPAEEEGQE